MNEPVEGLEMAETKDETEWMYEGDGKADTGDGSGVRLAHDAQNRPHVSSPGTKNLREYVRDGAGGLTERDRATLGRFRELAANVPATIEDMLRDEKLPAMARIRLIEIIMDRAYGKAEATVNVNGNVNGIEASEMRVEALVRSLKLEGNGYEERGD